MTPVLAILCVLSLSGAGFLFFKKRQVARRLAECEGALEAAKREAETVTQHYATEASRIHAEAEQTLQQSARDFDQRLAGTQSALAAAKQETESVLRHYESETVRIHAEAQSAIEAGHKLVQQKLNEVERRVQEIKEHYEREARHAFVAAESQISKLLAGNRELEKYRSVADAEAEAKKVIEEAISQGTALQTEARQLLDESKAAGLRERSEANRRARELREQAEALLTQATHDASNIVTTAEERAAKIAGDAYIALRDKETLDQALLALWNKVNGYGDRYVVPTRSVLDDLASDFSHTEAGVRLRAAREQSRRMVEEKVAATSNYEEDDRRERASRFVVDAFNGKVDAILTRVKHDNLGTLEQEIRDAFSLTNLNGIVFRDARILPAYLDSRLAELKWAIVVQELKRREREEQMRIKEQMREEEKVRREQEKAIREAQEKEALIREALEKARLEAEHANAQERAKVDAEIEELKKRLAEAEATKQREISLAQLTRAGNVYVISNMGSFGEDVFKIGMTRRREPMERIWELGDASVPFDFDVHALIYSDDAPSLERELHSAFDDWRINKVNYRKEFFRVPVQKLKEFVQQRGLNASFTMVADAHEFRETQALQNMSQEERMKYETVRLQTNGND